MLVVLGAAELTDDSAQDIILVWTDICEILGDKIVQGKDVSKFDEEGRFRSSVEIVELVNTKCKFRWRYIDYCRNMSTRS